MIAVIALLADSMASLAVLVWHRGLTKLMSGDGAIFVMPQIFANPMANGADDTYFPVLLAAIVRL
jgi:hypothetical protein